MELIISLIMGALGGNAVGKMAKNLDLGTLGNSIAGIIGGGLGSQIISAMTQGGEAVAAGGGTDMGAIISSVLSGGVGGGVLMAIIGVLKKMMAR